MIRTLNITADIKMTYVTNIDDVDYRVERTQSLGFNIFFLVSFTQPMASEKQAEEE